MPIQRFEEIIVWQKSKTIYLGIRKEFKAVNDRDFISQLFRATLSISNNIAEGFERKSNNELRHYLYIAKGSSGEVRSMLGIARELEYISLQTYQNKLSELEEISKMLAGFIRNLK